MTNMPPHKTPLLVKLNNRAIMYPVTIGDDDHWLYGKSFEWAIWPEMHRVDNERKTGLSDI